MSIHHSEYRSPANVLKKIPKKREVFIVAIDAGHGGEDPGAIGLNRTQEKKITLEISKKIMKLLKSENKIKGVLIRTGDYYIPLRKRCLLYTSPSPRDLSTSRMPSSA